MGWGNKGKVRSFQGKMRTKGQILRGKVVQRQYKATGNISEIDNRETMEHANLFQGNKGTGTTPLGRAPIITGPLRTN